MSATGVRRRERRQSATANRYRHSEQPSREELHRQVKRQQQEIENLRDQLAERQKELAEREKQLAEREKQLAEREKELGDAEKQIADAEKQIADLEQQLALRRQNSTNSSKPPSSDGLAGEQRSRGRKRKSKRKPGAQPGHPGHHRRLVPTAEVSAIEVLLPKQCEHCGGSLPKKPGQVTTEGESRRHQVTEIPPIKAHITEYQLPNVVCGRCGKTTRAPLPEEVAGHFGSQLTALIAYLTVVCRMPRRVVEALPKSVRILTNSGLWPGAGSGTLAAQKSLAEMKVRKIQAKFSIPPEVLAKFMKGANIWNWAQLSRIEKVIARIHSIAGAKQKNPSGGGGYRSTDSRVRPLMRGMVNGSGDKGEIGVYPAGVLCRSSSGGLLGALTGLGGGVVVTPALTLLLGVDIRYCHRGQPCFRNRGLPRAPQPPLFVKAIRTFGSGCSSRSPLRWARWWALIWQHEHPPPFCR